ncbi:MAG: hypothetical protein IPN20_07065 [Haliscomenobacter sp.]|nr:hypothetical protein [Haliscomenobacter sp.]
MDPEARALYEAHQKEMAVSFGVLETAKLEGKLEGKAEGRQEGLEIGLERKTTEVVVNAHKRLCPVYCSLRTRVGDLPGLPGRI